MKCPRGYCGGFLEFRVVDGVVVDHCDRCARLYAGVCRDCSAGVEGQVGRAIRCKAHKAARKAALFRDWLSNPDNRALKNRRYNQRRRKWSEERKEAQRVKARAWRAKNPDKVKQQHRRFLLSQNPRYLETQRKWNRDPVRVAKKRAWAIAKYYELHPVRPDPHCSGCSAKIEWDGKHRPRLTCDHCCTPGELRRRQRGYNRTAYLKRKAAA